MQALLLNINFMRASHARKSLTCEHIQELLDKSYWNTRTMIVCKPELLNDLTNLLTAISKVRMISATEFMETKGSVRQLLSTAKRRSLAHPKLSPLPCGVGLEFSAVASSKSELTKTKCEDPRSSLAAIKPSEMRSTVYYVSSRRDGPKPWYCDSGAPDSQCLYLVYVIMQ